MSRPSTRFIAISCLLLAGCGEGGAPDAAESPARTGTATMEVPAVDTDGAPAESAAAVPGAGDGDGGATGMTAEAVLEPRAGRVSLRVVLGGLTPGERYGVNVHQGTCRAGGPIRLPLGHVAARDDGTGSTRMTLDTGRLPDPPLFVQVQGPDGPAACADVQDATTP